MIQLGPRTKIYIGTAPVDFRKGHSGLSAVVKKVIGQDPLSGHVFVFKNKNGKSVKMICFDGRASWCFHLKFAEGKLTWWPTDGQISATQLMGLLSQSSRIEKTPLFRDVA